jgi:hypothetical protein
MTAPVALGTGSAPDPDKSAAGVPEAAELEAAHLDTADLEAAHLEAAHLDTADLEAGDREAGDREAGEPAESERRTSPLALIAMIVAVLVIAVGVFAIVTHGFRPKVKIAYQVPAVFKLRPGDCFNSQSGQNGIDFTLRACSTPHEAEVFATFPAVGSGWPGDAALQAEAETGCTARIAGYMNPALAANALDHEYIYPDAVAWQAGVRTVICDVRSLSGPITGSVRQGS